MKYLIIELTLVALVGWWALTAGAQSVRAPLGTEDVTITIGDTDTETVTIQTDDTGDGTDLVLPAGSVNRSELLDDWSTIIEFCGLGQAAGADSFWGPPLGMNTVYITGDAACDANTGVNIGAVDEILWTDFRLGYTVSNMECYTEGGVDDSVTYTLMDDAAATTITCDMALDGTGKRCSVFPEAPDYITGASLVGMRLEADDDNLAAVDFMCRLYISN